MPPGSGRRVVRHRAAVARNTYRRGAPPPTMLTLEGSPVTTEHYDKTPAEVGTAGAAVLSAAVGDPSAALHGRLLNVSRMATIGEMTAGIAHELNQPLAAILIYARACERLLARPDADLAEVRETLQQICVETTHAADIIRQLRALTEGERVARARVDINDLVSELDDLLRTDALMHGVQLSLDLAPELPPVAVDAGQVQHVILNFVRNSLEALVTPATANPCIVIRSRLTAAQEVELTVVDNGPGLAEQAHERVFQPFFSTKARGTGLGLAISRSIARAHGGSVGYRPTPAGGACFFLLLPAQPAE
jgi:two-component system, LuxR family, sensor kinase FixL